MLRNRSQILIFSYHKTGTSLFAHIVDKVAERLGLRTAVHYGPVFQVDPHADIVRLPHSLLSIALQRPFRAIRLVRDPRDVWVSGYLYHRHCQEFWCVNRDFDPSVPILPPRVDFSFLYRSEHWKRRYLLRLRGESYQQNLLDRSLADGLAFELENYTGCTLLAMRNWWLHSPAILTVRLEDVMRDFDTAILTIFRHWGFTESESAAALEVAQSEDINRMDAAAMAARPQIHGRSISKWPDILPTALLTTFEREHGDLITALGYQLASEPWFAEVAAS